MDKELEITISEMQLNGNTAVRIMKCLKEHEHEIWKELKETLKQKLPMQVVSDTFFCVYNGSCIYKGVLNICSNKEYCQSKRKSKRDIQL